MRTRTSPQASLLVASFVATAIVAASAIHAPSAYAQVTSAAAAGEVVSADGNPVSGLSVELRHVPSGTVSRTTTDADGRFNFRGVRVGGPYTINVSGALDPSAVARQIRQLLTQDAARLGLVNPI